MAIAEDKFEIAKMMYNHPNFKINHHIYRVIIFAVRVNQIKVLKDLLHKATQEKGIKNQINDFWIQGDSALHHAVRNGYGEIVEILLEYGADSSVLNRKGHTSLSLAIAEDKFEIAKMIYNHPNFKINDKTYVAILFAAEKNNVEIVKGLLKKLQEKQAIKNTIDTFCTKGRGNNALHWAVVNNNKEMVEVLRAYGADANLPNSYGQTAFGLAENPVINPEILYALKSHQLKAKHFAFLNEEADNLTQQGASEKHKENHQTLYPL